LKIKNRTQYNTKNIELSTPHIELSTPHIELEYSTY